MMLSTIFRNKNLKSKLLFALGFLIAVVLPCTIITLYANRLITEKIHSNNENFLNAITVTLDNALSAAASQVEIILESNASDYYKILSSSDFSDADTALAAYHMDQMMGNLLLNDDFFIDAFFYFKNPCVVFTRHGTFQEETFFGQYRIFESYSADFFQGLFSKNYKSLLCPPTEVYTSPGNGTSSFFSHVIPLALNPSGELASDAVLVLLLDVDKLNAVFDRLNTAKSCYIYLMDSQSKLMLNEPSETDYNALLRLYQMDYSPSTGRMTLNKDGSYQILWKSSSINQLLYICVEPALLITRQLRSTLLITILLILLIFLGTFLAYRTIARRVHHVFSNMLHRINLASYSGILSPQEHFHTDMGFLKDAVELLCSQHEDSRPQLVTAFLMRLFLSNPDKEEIMSFCTKYKLFLEDNCFLIFSLRINFEQFEEIDPSPKCGSLLSGIANCFAVYEYVVSIHDQTEFIVLLTGNAETILEEKLIELISSVRQFTEDIPECKCGCSLAFSDICEAYSMYRQMCGLLENHDLVETKFLYCPADLLSATNVQLLPEHKQKIRTLLKQNYSDCPRYIEELLQQFKNKHAGFSSYRSAIRDLFFMLQEYLYEEAIPLSSICELGESHILLICEHVLLPETMDAFVLNLYTKLAALLELRRSSINQAERTLLDYIDEHLAEVTLTALAESTGMNASYLSQYFKKHFGVTFLDYVTRKKIEKAKDLLRNTSLTCKAIGESLGYTDSNSFNRSFKKLESITPNEYRKIHKFSSDPSPL